MKKTILFLLLASITLLNSAYAQNSDSRYKLDWKAGLANDHFSNATDSANLVKTSIGFRGETKLVDSLTLNADFNLYWSTGRAQSWYGADGYSTGLNFNQAVIKFTPLSYIELKAGAVSLKYLRSPLLVSSGPFPGFFAKLASEENEIVDFGLIGLYSLPTSRSLNSDRIEKELEPSFTTLSAIVSTGKNFDLLGADFIFSFFKYDKLPSKVAYESSLKGNSVIANTDADSRFIYVYQGFSAGIGGFATLFGEYKLKLNYTYLLNTEGPTVGNRGELLRLSCDIPLLKHMVIPYLEIFYNEADSSVSYYNSTHYGNNNRQGYSIGGSFIYDELFTVNFRFTDADLINVNNSISSRNQMIFVGLETSFISIL